MQEGQRRLLDLSELESQVFTACLACSVGAGDLNSSPTLLISIQLSSTNLANTYQTNKCSK